MLLGGRELLSILLSIVLGVLRVVLRKSPSTSSAIAHVLGICPAHFVVGRHREPQIGKVVGTGSDVSSTRYARGSRRKVRQVPTEVNPGRRDARAVCVPGCSIQPALQPQPVSKAAERETQSGLCKEEGRKRKRWGGRISGRRDNKSGGVGKSQKRERASQPANQDQGKMVGGERRRSTYCDLGACNAALPTD